MKTKVLIVDDSAVVRNVLTEIFSTVPDIEVIAAASDPIFAMRYMEEQWPDVIVLDIEMPRMDGITFLRKLMSEHPTPVVVCSTLTEEGAETTLNAMDAGAIEIITKPKLALKEFLHEQKTMLIDAVKAAAKADMSKVKPRVHTEATHKKPNGTNGAKGANGANGGKPLLNVPKKLNADAVIAPPGVGNAMAKTTEKVIAIGTSTGGTQALEAILTQLPRVSPGIVIVQHMPEKFTKAFADRLNGLCEIEVKEAENNDRVIPGRALIAPGGKHMMLKRSGAQYYVEIADGPLVSRHKPSVDVLFRSVAKCAGQNALGIIMTGMGDDGASGLLEMKESGAETMAQDEASSVVFGMPKEAIKRGATDRVISLNAIPREIIDRASHRQ